MAQLATDGGARRRIDTSLQPGPGGAERQANRHGQHYRDRDRAGLVRTRRRAAGTFGSGRSTGAPRYRAERLAFAGSGAHHDAARGAARQGVPPSRARGRMEPPGAGVCGRSRRHRAHQAGHGGRLQGRADLDAPGGARAACREPSAQLGWRGCRLAFAQHARCCDRDRARHGAPVRTDVRVVLQPDGRRLESAAPPAVHAHRAAGARTSPGNDRGTRRHRRHGGRRGHMRRSAGLALAHDAAHRGARSRSGDPRLHGRAARRGQGEGRALRGVRTDHAARLCGRGRACSTAESTGAVAASHCRGARARRGA